MDITNIALPLRGLGASSVSETAERIQQMGVRAITFHGAPVAAPSGQAAFSFLWEELDAATQAATRSIRQQFERGVMHAPFKELPLVSSDPAIEREAYRQISMAVRAAGALDLEVVTVHAGLPVPNIPFADFRDRLVTVLRRLGDEAQRAGTIIGVENWRYPADPEQHSALLDAVDHPAVAATLDVGHIVYWLQRDGVVALCDSDAIAGYHQRLCAFIDALGERIVHVHVHDVQPEPLLDHRPIGSGIIDFPALINRLAQFNFDGLLLLELAGPPPLSAWEQSVEHLLAAMKSAHNEDNHA